MTPQERITALRLRESLKSQASGSGGGRNVQGARNKARGQRNKISATEIYQQVLDARGEASQQRAQEVKDMSYFEQGGVRLGRELDKLGAGVRDVGNFIDDTLGSDTAINKTIALQNEQVEKDRTYKEFDENVNPVVDMVSGALPYLLSGGYGGTGAKKVASKLFDIAGDVVVAPAKATARAAGKGIDELAKRSGISRRLGREASDMFVKPARRIASRKKKQYKWDSPFNQDVASEIAAGAGLGLVEGGLHYDYSPLEGALGGGLGNIGGLTLGRMFKRSPDFYGKDSVERDTINWWKDQGGTPSPGLETGSNSQQIFESGLRQSEELGYLMKSHDQAEQVIANRTAFNTMGIEPGDADVMTRAKFKAHKKATKEEYKALEAGTTAELSTEQFTAIQDQMNLLKQSMVPANKAAYKTAQGHLADLSERLDIGEEGASLAGADFQKLRSGLKSDISKAWKDSDMGTVDALQPMVDMLDEGVEKGVRDEFGDVGVAQWKDANERHAMSKLVSKHGLTTTGKFDEDKMARFIKSTDMDRLLSGTGGRVQDLHNLTTLRDIKAMRSGSSLTGHGLQNLRNSAKPSLLQRAITSPIGQFTGLANEQYMKLYLSGYPSTTGLLNMSGEGFGKPAIYSRALEQGNKTYADAARDVEGAYDASALWMNSLMSDN